MGRLADFWQRVDALDSRIARAMSGRRPPEQRGTQSWWNLAGIPGLISSSAYGAATVDQALRNAATFACVDVLADGVARTPLDAIRGTGGSKQVVTPDPPLLANPSGIVLKDVWRYQLAWSLLTDGNCFGRILNWGRYTYPSQIELLDPSTVSARQVVNGQPQVKIDNQVEKIWPFGDIWHVPGRMVPAGTPFGLSPIEYANRVIQTSLSAEDFSYRFFADGGHPTMAIASEKELTGEQAEKLKAAWRRAVDVGSREAVVHGSGVTLNKLSIDPAETQFIDLMRFEVEQTCRFWRVPPSMVYAAISGQNVTYANVTDADLHYLKHSLDGYLVRLEECLTELLPKPQYVRANRNAMLRPDPKTRYEIYQIQIRNGLNSRNEIRAIEDEPPITDGTGDQYVWPPVGQGAGQDVRPPATGGVAETPSGPTGNI